MTPRFHTLRIAEVRRETPEAVSLRFEVPRELAPDYAFTQGQHITLRARLDGEELRRSYSICAGVDDARAARGDQEGARRHVLHLREREPQARRRHRRAHAGGALSHRARRCQPQALRRLRRRQRHHPGALAHQDHAQARATQPFHPAVRQPPPVDRDVPGRAGGPEGPLSRPADPLQPVQSRASGSGAVQRPPRRRAK